MIIIYKPLLYKLKMKLDSVPSGYKSESSVPVEGTEALKNACNLRDDIANIRIS